MMQLLLLKFTHLLPQLLYSLFVVLLFKVLRLLRKTCLDEKLPIVELSLEVNEVPVLYEMPGKIHHTVPSYLYSDVMPRHPGNSVSIDHAHLVLPGSIDI